MARVLLRFIGDIGIVGDHIAAIGDLHHAAAKQRMDAAGLVASPGFVDVQGQSEFNVLVDNRAASKITQGVTTEITGEGTSIAPFNNRLLEDFQDSAKKYGVALDWRSLDEYLRRYDHARPAINLGTFVGAGGLREYVMGKDDRPATPAELEQMRQLVTQAMEQGAFGLSSALQYVILASTEKLLSWPRLRGDTAEFTSPTSVQKPTKFSSRWTKYLISRNVRAFPPRFGT